MSEVFRDMLQLPQVPGNQEGTCNANPVPLPEIKAEQFRNLLYIFYESPVDADLMIFMSGASNKQNHSPEAFKHYLDIASLSRRYLMQPTEDWAYAQLQVISSTIPFAERAPLPHIPDALNYAKIRSSGSNDDDFVRNIRYASACAMCGNPRSGYCLGVYQSPPEEVDRLLFAISYISILSLGHKSKQWAGLTGSDRAILYASQVHLAPLPDTLPFRPLVSASNIIGAVGENEPALSLCEHARGVLSSTWVGSIVDWETPPATDGIVKIRGLPLKRRRLLKVFQSSPCQCNEQCGKLVLARVDTLIEALLNAILDLRKGILK
ncbi:hypothetical protein FRC09_008044 [Ceratobasidium sp. 395]|nr:hypothetical protein FRC09_008044 [Ceratobasidium sp. 395]